MNRFPVENIDKVEEATNAELASKATQLETSRTIKLTGDVTGSASFNGTGDASITATVADDSHNHTIANIDGLQTTLDNINDTIESAVSTAGASLEVSGTTLKLKDSSGNVLSTVTTQDTNTTYTAATAAPLVAGTAAVGTSTKYAREDHVHPVQTTLSTPNEIVRSFSTYGTAHTVLKTQSPNSGQAIITVSEPNSTDTYGHVLKIGGNGVTIIGSGESPNSCMSENVTVTNENTYIVSDNNIYFYTNGNTYANKKTATLDASGNLTIAGTLTASGGISASVTSAAKLTTARRITMPASYMYQKSSNAYVDFNGSSNVSFACNGCTGCSSACSGSCTGCSGHSGN